MLLNLIVFKFVPGILKSLDVWWMSFFVFFIFSCKFIFIKKKKNRKIANLLSFPWKFFEFCQGISGSTYDWQPLHFTSGIIRLARTRSFCTSSISYPLICTQPWMCQEVTNAILVENLHTSPKLIISCFKLLGLGHCFFVAILYNMKHQKNKSHPRKRSSNSF